MDLVLETLAQAASQNAADLQVAEGKLRQWEGQSGFHSVLLNIYRNQNVEPNVRWLAVVYLKNGVDKYWRQFGKEETGGITNEEKQQIREGLLNCLSEPVDQIAAQLAVLTAKIARIDYPREWPQIIPKLVETCKSDDSLTQHRCFLTLNNVVKQLASKRLLASKYTFQEMTGEIFSIVLNVWNRLSESFTNQQVNRDDKSKRRLLENCLLALKTLRKLTVHGFKNPSECADVNTFLKLIFDNVKAFLELRKADNGSLVEMLEKYIINLMKVLLAALEYYPVSFINYIEPSLKLCIYYAFTPEGEPFLFEKFLIQNLNLMKNILICSEYVPPKKTEDAKEMAIICANEIKHSVFTREVLVTMCHKLIMQYFLLTPQDLQQWDSNPEEYMADESGKSWKYSLRPCLETLFHSILHEFGSVLNPVLLELVNANHSLAHPNDMDAILRKDAVYNAIGLAAFELYDEINFDEWFLNSLVLELKIKDPNYRIIRKRVAWLIGYWINVSLSTENRPTLYEAMLPLLQPDEDMAVRLTAANTIKLAVDDFGFNSEEFLKYLEPLFTLLFQLLKDAQECDSKMQVLNVLSFIVVRVGSAIKPFYNSLVQYLPLLWEQSEDYNLLRCAIVSALVRLMQTLAMSQNLPWDFLLSVIDICTNVYKNDHVYLLLDGLDLWLAILRNTSELNDGLLQIFKNMPPLLTEYTTENLKICQLIIQAYVILAPEQFLKVCGETVIEACISLLTDLKADGVVMVLRTYETCLRANPSLSIQLLTMVQPEIAGQRKPALSYVFEGIYFKNSVIMVQSMYLSIVSRVLLFSKETFVQLINVLSQKICTSQEEVLSTFLANWLLLGTVSLTCHGKRKLNALALASLLTSQSSIILEKFNKIVRFIVEVLNDILVKENGVLLESYLSERAESPHYSFESDTDSENEHDRRCKTLANNDPVQTIYLRQYFQSQINELKSQVDPATYNNMLQSVKMECMQQACEYVQF